MDRTEQKRKSAKFHPHRGSKFEDFLKEEGIYEEVAAGALMRKAIKDIQLLLQ